VRCEVEAYRAPPVLIDAAIGANLSGKLGRLIRQKATQSCPGFPLFLNLHPSEFDEGYLVRPDDAIFSHDDEVYLEVTESVPLSHFSFCHSVLAELRTRGMRLAVDDLGAGYSNLKYISDLHPDVVKLDRELIRDLADDERLYKLVAAVVRLCDDLGAKVVAEGIETAAELKAVTEAGAHFAQGYQLARPDKVPPQPDLNALLGG
jgi:EAL domain-containing protein (putative c-di-GMP-specific phosphodiesterase class I)